MHAYRGDIGLLTVVVAVSVLLVLTIVLCHASQPSVPVAAWAPHDTTAAVSDVAITDVTTTTVRISWNTNAATASCLNLDSAIHPVFPDDQPISQTFQGVAYAPGEYGAYLDWVDRDRITNTIASDVETIAGANFNGIVLYPAGPLPGGAIHPWDRITLDTAAQSELQIVFRLEWYPPLSFDWEHEDCDQVLNHYDAYVSHFEVHPDQLLYFLVNMPLDDLSILEPNPSMTKQRDYIRYCYDALKARTPEASVYANTYYGWQDELYQAPVGDLVDGVSVVAYAQHAKGAPFDCSVIPTANHPASTLICKDQFEYYLDKAWHENNLAKLDRPLVVDPSGFAPAASYAVPDQKNGTVADSWAKVTAIGALRRTLEQDTRLYGWSYFKLLPKDEAHWGLIDRRRITDPAITTTHQLTLTDLFPATPYTLTLQAGSAVSGPYTFATLAPPAGANTFPLITVTKPPYGHETGPAGGQLAITWRDDDPDDGATIGLYYDNDDAGCDGTLITSSLSEDHSVDMYTWTLPMALPTGSYYIYAQISDGTNPTECDYSSGQFVPSTDTLKVVSKRGAVSVDGVMDEPVWQSALPLIYAIHTDQTDGTTATVRALWDWDYLYLGFEVKDKQVETANVDWDDDSVSILFSNGEFQCRQDVGGTGEGACDRTVHWPECTTLDDTEDNDCEYTVEMRIHWTRARITANAGDVLPTDLLSVDHDGNPGAPYTQTEFSKLSWDGDSSVDTSGRSLSLVDFCDQWPCIWLPVISKE